MNMSTNIAVWGMVLALVNAPGVLEAQVTEDWVATYPGWFGAGVATDGSGNIYVAGTTLPDAAHGFREDIVIIKYNTEGTVVWSREFDETDDGTNGTDIAKWIAIDPSGNILITGGSFINSTGDDFITLKYDPDGNLIWKARSTSGLSATRVETDGSGNVYVMGPSSTVPSARDYVTIKYDSDGNQLWERTYNGPNGFDDNPRSLAVSTDGFVAVTGTSTGGVTSFDIATILYDTNGNQLWVKRYDATNGQDSGNDVAFGLNNSVYVAGYTFDNVSFATDGILIKYDVVGNEAWARIHNPTNGYDVFNRIRVDSEGNPVVAGYQTDLNLEFVTSKYSPEGVLLWTQGLFYGGDHLVWGMAIGMNDAVYVTGESGQDAITFKYTGDGILQWSQTYDSGLFPDRSRGFALDSDGGIVITGESPFLTIRYSEETNQPPVVADIPDQTISSDSRFLPIRADRYVADPDDPDSSITWTWMGNVNTRVFWDSVRRGFRVRSRPGWTGSETITFIATDPGGLSDSDPATFTVDPPLISKSKIVPAETNLAGTYPNPFNPSTNINYSLGLDGHVRLRIFNILGEEIIKLVDGFQEAGVRSVVWDGRDNNGQAVPSGVYFSVLEAAQGSGEGGLQVIRSEKMILSK